MSELEGPSESASHDQAFADLFEHAPCGYMTLSPDGRITRANATLARWLGVSAGRLHGLRLRDQLTVPGRIFYETSFAPLLRLTGGVEEMALDFVCANGEPLAVLINASERQDAEGRAIEVRVIVTRATERRGYERALQGREAVAVQALADEQAISTLREQFIAILGHDLRNPLASVSSGVRLLLRDPTRERAEKIATMMHASVLRMSGMIDNVLDFARGRLGGGIALQRQPSDLGVVMLQVVEELRTAHPDRGIDLTYSLPPRIDCDPARMSQMLSNLVGNACAHGDPATFVAVDAFVKDATLEISISNGGAAIPDHKLRALFEPFSYEPGSAPRQGLGLGLFISAQIAKSHDGLLTVSSSDDATVFTFRMPLASA